MRRGFTLMEILMGMALLALILVAALCVLQWALLGSTRQQAQTRAAFLAQQQMEILCAADEPKSGQGTLGNGFAWKTQVKPLDEFVQLAVQVKGPAGSAFTLTTERRKDIQNLVFRSQDKVLQTTEDIPEPASLTEGIAGDFCISPDGQQVAYVTPYEGRPQIWLRRLHSAETPQLLINHPEGAAEPRFSPVDPSFNIPGQYTPANYPGVSLTSGDIWAFFENFVSSGGQSTMFHSPIPIDIKRGSGRYSHSFADLVVYSRTVPLYLGRTHASDQQARLGHFGWNWSFDEKLVVFQNQAIYQLPDGGVVTYQDDGDGYKSVMNHITTKLTRLDDRTFRFDYKGGGSSVFKIPAGLDPASEKPVWAVLQKATDTHGFSNTFQWDTTGQKLLKMQGPDSSQWIQLQWARCDTPQLLSACDSHGRTVCYDYRTYKGPGGVRDELLSGVTVTGDRKVQFRYHPVLGQRKYELLDVLHNEVLQEKVVGNPASPGQLAEVTHRPDQTLTFKRNVDTDSGQVTTVLTKKSASNNSPGGFSQSLTCQIDGKDRVIGVRDDLGHETHCEFDEFYNVVHVFDLVGHDLRMTYDERRNLLSATDQAGRVTRTEWDAEDNPIATIDPLGRRSTATFDAQRNPLSLSDPLEHTTRMAWNGLGQLTSITDNNGNQVSMGYDAKGFLKTIQLPATAQNGPAITSVERNSADELVRSTDPLGRVHLAKRDAIGRVVETIAPAVQGRFRQESLPPARSRMSYTRNDQLESMTSVDGRVTQYGYDSAERLVEVQETGYPAPTKLTYDAFDNLLTLTRPNGAVTRYEYDRLNRVSQVTYPGGDTESLTYDDRGRVTQWRAGSRLVTYEYDSVDRLIHMSCPSTGDDYHYQYDDANRLLSMQDQTGTTSYEYTQNDRLQRVTHPGNRSLTYGFDAGDRLVSTLDPENVATSYEYNQRNELVRATHDGQVMNYGYDLLGRATEIQYPNGVRGTQIFDERDRLLYRDYRKGGTPLVTLKYAYNQLGQRILDDRTMPNGNQLASFTYNQRLELTRSERRRGGGCGPGEVHSYAYDLNHNITKKDGVSYTNNLADQLLSVAGGGTLTYNDSGAATNVQGWDVSYNCADQITGIQAPGKNIAYRYDAAGQRVSKSVNGVTQNFLWNGSNIAKEYTSAGVVRADYFLGAGREGIKTNGQWYYYLSDIQGSTLMLTNSSGQSAATYDYEDYGETRQTSGSTSLYNPFLYTGQEYDFETSLYHLRARHYSPGLGRFFSRDPIGYAGGSNMMGYCAGDPINRRDPSGLIEDSVSQEVLAQVAEGNIEEVVFILEAEGPTVGSQSWNLLRNYRAASQFLYKKLGRKAAGDCYQVSMRVLDQLKSFGIQGKILRIQASGSYMYWRGVLIADRGFHQAVIVGNMVYDKLTGGGGMRYDQYMQIINEGAAGAQVVPVP